MSCHGAVTQLFTDIPLNAISGSKPVVTSNNSQPDFGIGHMKINVIGPDDEALKELKEEWAQWAASLSGSRAIGSVRRKVVERGESFTEYRADDLKQLMVEASADLSELSTGWQTRKARRDEVTVPNTSSLIFVASEDGRSVLCTGDAHQADIAKGLRSLDTWKDQERIHFSAIKVPHHSSEDNSDSSFWKRHIADHYVFCADGSHDNPDLDVLAELIHSRVDRDQPADAYRERNFTIWIGPPGSADESQAHIRRVHEFLSELSTRDQLSGRLRIESMDNSPTEISF